MDTDRVSGYSIGNQFASRKKTRLATLECKSGRNKEKTFLFGGRDTTNLVRKIADQLASVQVLLIRESKYDYTCHVLFFLPLGAISTIPRRVWNLCSS
jgi:hypothetical protein